MNHSIFKPAACALLLLAVMLWHGLRVVVLGRRAAGDFLEDVNQ